MNQLPRDNDTRVNREIAKRLFHISSTSSALFPMDPPTSRLVKVDLVQHRRRRASGPVIVTPTGTYAQRPQTQTSSQSKQTQPDLVLVDDVSDSVDTGIAPPKPTTNERQSTNWRDVVIPALIKPYEELCAATNGLATLKNVKSNRFRCEGCSQGNSLKIICLYFDQGLRGYLSLSLCTVIQYVSQVTRNVPYVLVQIHCLRRQVPVLLRYNYSLSGYFRVLLKDQLLLLT